MKFSREKINNIILPALRDSWGEYFIINDSSKIIESFNISRGESLLRLVLDTEGTIIYNTRTKSSINFDRLQKCYDCIIAWSNPGVSVPVLYSKNLDNAIMLDSSLFEIGNFAMTEKGIIITAVDRLANEIVAIVDLKTKSLKPYNNYLGDNQYSIFEYSNMMSYNGIYINECELITWSGQKIDIDISLDDSELLEVYNTGTSIDLLLFEKCDSCLLIAFDPLSKGKLWDFECEGVITVLDDLVLIFNDNKSSLIKISTGEILYDKEDINAITKKGDEEYILWK